MKLLGLGFVLLSIVATLLGLGAPGLGWGLATLTMIAASLRARSVGRAALIVCLAITLFHALSWGPLATQPASSYGGVPLLDRVFTAAPFVAGIVALALLRLRPRP